MPVVKTCLCNLSSEKTHTHACTQTSEVCIICSRAQECLSVCVRWLKPMNNEKTNEYSITLACVVLNWNRSWLPRARDSAARWEHVIL